MQEHAEQLRDNLRRKH